VMLSQLRYHQEKSLDKAPPHRKPCPAKHLRWAGFNFIKFWRLIYSGHFLNFSLDATFPCAREGTFFCARPRTTDVGAREMPGSVMMAGAGSARRLPTGLPADPYVPN
jgi:hypothetical protein